MIVLTSKVGESVFIGEGIEVRILHITPTQVRLGYIAPKSVNVLRSKLKAQLEADGVEVYTTKPEKQA